MISVSEDACVIYKGMGVGGEREKCKQKHMQIR